MKRKNITGLIAVSLLIAILGMIIDPVNAEEDDIIDISTEASTDITTSTEASTDTIIVPEVTEEDVKDVSADSSTEATFITVVSPNGGENWVRGTTKIIRWSYSGIGGNVKIELLKGGVVNRVIIASTPNDGSHSWAILSGQTLGNDYKIRITSLSNSGIKDTSNGNFIISTGYTVVKFYSNKKTYTQIPIELVGLTLQNAGTTPVWVKQSEPWKIINVATGKTVNLPICAPFGYGSCGSKKLMPGEKITKNWNQKDNSGALVPPGTYIASARYAKTDPSGSTTMYIVYTVFTIIKQPSITVVSPNGGENWKRGTTHTISWSRIGDTGSNVKIELLKGGAVNKVIIASTPNDGSHSWAIPSGQTLGSDYKVRVTSTTNSAYKDTSNGNFIISS